MATRTPRPRAPQSAERAKSLDDRAVLSTSGGIRTSSLISFRVHGLPVPQGSTRAFVVNGRPVITSAAKGLSSWRRLVADVAQRFAPDEPWEGPVGIELHFGIPKPKSAPKRRRGLAPKKAGNHKLSPAVFRATT